MRAKQIAYIIYISKSREIEIALLFILLKVYAIALRPEKGK